VVASGSVFHVPETWTNGLTNQDALVADLAGHLVTSSSNAGRVSTIVLNRRGKRGDPRTCASTVIFFDRCSPCAPTWPTCAEDRT